MKLTLRFLDRDIVNAGFAASHQAIVIELPLLVTVSPEPLARFRLPLINKTNLKLLDVDGFATVDGCHFLQFSWIDIVRNVVSRIVE